MAGAPHKTEDLALLLDDYAVFVGAVLATRNPGLALAVQMPWTELGLKKSLPNASNPRFSQVETRAAAAKPIRTNYLDWFNKADQKSPASAADPSNVARSIQRVSSALLQ
eukprot:3418590-Prymnesium_polylepis.1